MKLLMHIPQLLVSHMGVYLRRGYIGVSQHHLYAPDVGPVREQIGRETVADDVRSHFLGDAGDDGVMGNDTLD